MTGKFISLEGVDCGGKTTNVSILVEFLKQRGYNVIRTREPGGTPLSEEIRKIVLENKMQPTTSMLLMAAQRSENLHDIILPALKRGDIVVSDRFLDSSYAYQGYGRGIVDVVIALEKLILKDFEPDFTLFFDLPFAESERRLQVRHQQLVDSGSIVKDVFENESVEFRKRVYDGYQERYKQNLHRMYRINSLPKPDAVAQQVMDWAAMHFEDLTR